MNKKLMIAVVAAFLSVTSVNATDITGVTGSGGIFNIDPGKVNGDVGYRQYENFDLSKGDIANLIYKYGNRDLETFINLVDNQVNIQGIVNTMRDGNFYNGHAIFISPKGMVVGASGVLNVGTLSVLTPEQNKYNSLTADYEASEFGNINQISQLKKDGNAPINIEGLVFARNGVDLRGNNIDISGGILNAYNGTSAMDSASEAKSLFDRLVNTDGITSSANAIDNGSLVLIRAYNDGNSTDGITVSGKIANLGNRIVRGDDGGVSSGVFLTNEGAGGIDVQNGAVIDSNNRVQLYNKNGDLTVNGSVSNKNDTLIVTNRENAGNLTIGGKLSTDNEIAVSNKGTGKLTVSGTTSSDGRTDIVNEGAGGMDISGTIGDTSVDKVRIINRGGQLAFLSGANVNAGRELQVENTGSGGLTVENNAKLTSQENFGLKNKAGEMNIAGQVGVVDGDMNVWNYEGASGLTLASTGKINGQGNLSIKNTGANGMTLNGTISNTGETAINNTAGKMTVNGVIDNEGNMGIINKENGTGLDIQGSAKITNEGDLKIVNSSGANGLNIEGNVENTGNMRVYNENGHLTLAGQGSLENHDGYLYVFSRNNSTGITTGANTNISNEMDGLAIKHEGTTAAGNEGMRLEGTITNSDAETAINNYSGDMYVAGDINVTDSNLGIINREGGGKVTFAEGSTITNTGTGNMNIKNYGSGDMTVSNEITHEGRLNILGNSGHLYLDGQIHNNGGDYTYAASRANGTGLTATENFKVDGSGNILIKNITGTDGLDFNGTIENTDGTQSALVNHKGDMNITGDITNSGSPVIISNKGNGLNITSDSTITNDEQVKIVNTGSQAATMNGTVNAPKEQYSFIERLKQALGIN